MPAAPDIVLCSILCRHNPADPSLVISRFAEDDREMCKKGRCYVGCSALVIRFQNIRIHPSTRYRIRALRISSLESGFKHIRIRCRIRWMPVEGSHIRKEKGADVKISGYV